jgi:hypothetical protein
VRRRPGGRSGRDYARAVRRRDLAIGGPYRRSRRSLIVALVFVAVFALILVWIALQTLGGPSPES